MSHTPHLLAISDLGVLAIVLCVVFLSLLVFGDWVCDLFNPATKCGNFGEPIDDAAFDEPNLEETGIACGTVKLPVGAQLVEIDTAGMLTPPEYVMVTEYRWTGSAVEFVRRVPLHEFSFIVPAPSSSNEQPASSIGVSAEWPELKQAREQFQNTAALVSNGAPLGRKVSEF